MGALDGIPAVSGATVVFLRCVRELVFAECEISFMRGLFAYRSKPTFGDLHALPYGDKIGLSA
jgi:hypothetical protein